MPCRIHFTGSLNALKNKTRVKDDEALRNKPHTLGYVLNHLKTQKICEETVCIEPYGLEYVSNDLKTQ